MQPCSSCLIALNEPCLEDGGCLNGNVCDVYTDGTSLCKSPMGGNCRDISDCSYTIADPRLECTLEGGSNDNRVCGIPTAVEPPAPSQAAAKRNRKMVKARMLANLQNVCPQRTIACPLQSDNSFECVNPNEEVSSRSNTCDLSSSRRTLTGHFQPCSLRTAGLAATTVRVYREFMS